ncbi:MAG: WYL domain-containing protein [Bacteroidales bacterium]|jgi:predicted DNA-binding transcriptional regulator YafY
MSKRESIARYNIIIKKLRKYPATLQEIMNELELESEIQSYKFTISKRTFQRDLADIRGIYNIDIQYNFATGKYFIDYDDQSTLHERIFEAYDTFNALNLTDRLSRHIHFESRKPQGTENLYGLLHAIKNKKQIKFTHQKYWDNEPTNRQVEPYALKEFKNRWYVLTNDLKDNQVKSFSLDRITNLEITKTPFINTLNFDVNVHYKNFFGIVSPNDQEPQEVIISCNPLKGKYIKSLPLHSSQKILIDNDEEFRFSLFVVVTYDFIVEILSHGDNMKVLAPTNLIDELKGTYFRALAQY